MSVNNSDQVAARTLYRWHGVLSQPTYLVVEYLKRWGNPLTPHIFDNYSTKTSEFAYRAFVPTVLLGTAAFLFQQGVLLKFGLLTIGCIAALEISRLVLHRLAFSKQQKSYIYVRSTAPEVASQNPKIMSWNILGFPAGLNYTCGGCIPFRKRFGEIADLISRENPDIVILQECWMDASVPEMFIDKFKDQYAHFFIHNGSLRWGIDSGLLVMSKCPVEDYTFTPFKTNDWRVARGFATLKIKASEGRPAFAVIGTHMEAGNDPDDIKKRKEQLDQIQAAANALQDVSTVILAGDTNIDASEVEDLNSILVKVHRPEGRETCTNDMHKLRYPKNSSPSRVWLDQIGVIRRETPSDLSIREFKVIPVYLKNGKVDSSVALSDHNALVGRLNKSEN